MGWIAAGEAAASLAAGGLNFAGQHIANQANKAVSREQMAFQERMSSTAYQRAMHDMEQAGLNPMLAYQQGGASSPGGASMAQQNEIGPAVNSALDVRRAFAEINNMRALNKNLNSQNEKLKADTALSLAQARNADALYPSLKAEADIDSEDFGRMERKVRRLLPYGSAIGSGAAGSAYGYHRYKMGKAKAAAANPPKHKPSTLGVYPQKPSAGQKFRSNVGRFFKYRSK